MSKKEIAVITVAVLAVLVSLYHWSGSLVVGTLAGLFYAQEVNKWTKQGREFLEGKDRFQTLLMASILLCVFFAVPSLFFGVLAGIGVRSLIR